jgi:hypothetical protein
MMMTLIPQVWQARERILFLMLSLLENVEEVNEVLIGNNAQAEHA